MPKLKTNRGAAKRFRRTANGYKHRRAYKNHILTKKASKRKRQLRGLGQCITFGRRSARPDAAEESALTGEAHA